MDQIVADLRSQTTPASSEFSGRLSSLVPPFSNQTPTLSVPPTDVQPGDCGANWRRPGGTATERGIPREAAARPGTPNTTPDLEPAPPLEPGPAPDPESFAREDRVTCR